MQKCFQPNSIQFTHLGENDTSRTNLGQNNFLCIFLKIDILRSVNDNLTYGQEVLDHEKVQNNYFFMVKKLLAYSQKVFDTLKYHF